MSQSPVCVKCATAYRVALNEVWLSTPGALRCGDLWRCPNCGHEMLTGLGKPILEHDYRYSVMLGSARESDQLIEVNT